MNKISALSIVALIVGFLQTVACLAQEGMLSVDLAASSPRLRTGAPANVVWQVRWLGDNYVEGHFEAEYYAFGREVKSLAVTDPVGLNPGVEHHVRMSFIGPSGPASWGSDEIALRFVTQEQTFDLTKRSRYPLIGGPGQRRVSVCLLRDRIRRQTRDRQDFIDGLRFRNLLPHLKAEDVSPVSTAFTTWERNDLTFNPLHLLSFDIVVVDSTQLGSLREKQLAALTQWTRAGGSLLIFLGEDVSGNHVDFLNDLLRETSKRPVFLLNSEGELQPTPSSTSSGRWIAKVDLGRAVVVDPGQLPQEGAERVQAVRDTSRFLWKVRQDYMDADHNRRKALHDRFDARSFFQPVRSGTQYLERMMPEEVEVVPTGVMAAVLLSYILLIGPIDYYVLGYFRMRRFTWITFPLITVGIAAVCVQLSEAYLSSSTTSRTLFIRDIGSDGAPLRENQLELRFISSRSKLSTEVQNATSTPLGDSLLIADHYYNSYAYGRPRQFDSKPAQLTGTVPASYQIEQLVEQWTPQVNRYLRFELTDHHQIPWPANGTDFRRITERDAIANRFAKDLPNATVILLHERQMINVTANGPVFPGRDENGRRHDRWGVPNPASDEFLLDICRRPAYGLFSVIAQQSPTGGEDLLDLPIHDDSDPHTWLMIVAIEQGRNQDLCIYRRVYRDQTED